VNYQKLVLTPRTVEELTGILQPRAKDEEENRSRLNSSEGEGAESRQLPTDTGAQA
jgi:hypothetical protein